MSTLAEQVDEEQAEYEREGEREPEPEDESDAQPAEPETIEPEAAVAIGPEEIKRAEKAIAGQRKRLGDILGHDSVAHDCLMCAGMGFVPALPPPGVTFTIVETEDGPALHAEEPRNEPPYKMSETTAMCEACDGWGLVLTGARTEGGRLWQCSVCGGSGHVAKQGAVSALSPVAVAGAPPPVAAVTPLAEGVADAWGRPAGHQHWGVPPAAIPG